MVLKHENGYTLEKGYEELLSDNLQSARNIFAELKDYDPRARWANVLVGLIDGNLHEYPTYFQIRNFLEIDIDILIKNYKGEYVENIMRYTDFLAQINPEVYKYIGRVFINNDLRPQGSAMFLLAKNYFYKDPELHYLMAETYYNDQDFASANKSLNICLEILPQYLPAMNLLKKIKQ